MTTMKPVQIHIPVTQATALSIAARAANLTLEEMASAFVAETFVELIKSIKASQRLTPAPDSNAAPQSIPAAIPMPTPTMMLAATPAPAAEEEAPSDEDPFAEFHNNQKQPTAHHA